MYRAMIAIGITGVAAAVTIRTTNTMSYMNIPESSQTALVMLSVPRAMRLIRPAISITSPVY